MLTQAIVACVKGAKYGEREERKGKGITHQRATRERINGKGVTFAPFPIHSFRVYFQPERIQINTVYAYVRHI